MTSINLLQVGGSLVDTISSACAGLLVTVLVNHGRRSEPEWTRIIRERASAPDPQPGSVSELT
jgi:hypothetical protein